MRRRDVIGAAATAAMVATRPVVAASAPAPGFHRVGTLTNGGLMDETSPFGRVVVAGLREHGYVLGQNLALEARGTGGRTERLSSMVAELIDKRVEVIIAQGFPTSMAAKLAGRVPVVVVFGTGDPVATGLVQSLARPGGLVTGMSDVSIELSPKRIQLLKEVSPGLKRLAILWNADDVGMTLRVRESEAAAPALDVEVQSIGMHEPEDFPRAFSLMEERLPDGLLMVNDTLTHANRNQVFAFAAAHKIPAMYEADYFVRGGGLMSYGPDLQDSFIRATSMVDRILKGAAAAEMPFENPTRFLLAVNTKTAARIGLRLPASILGRADVVID